MNTFKKDTNYTDVRQNECTDCKFSMWNKRSTTNNKELFCKLGNIEVAMGGLCDKFCGS